MDIIPPAPIIDADSIFCNESGYIRLFKVNQAFGFVKKIIGEVEDPINPTYVSFITKRYLESPLSFGDLDKITELYVKWRDQREVLPVLYTYGVQRITTSKPDNSFNLPISEYKGFYFSWDVKEDASFRVTPKRGNDVYTEIVTKRLDPLLKSEPIYFFDPAYRGLKKTPMLYITVTTDPKEVGGNVGEAWLRFGEKWNKFITNLRNKFGKICYIRTWQSQNNYMPHAHALVYFVDCSFTAVRWVDDTGNVSFRIPGRSKARQMIKDAWKWGYCDIQAVSDTHTAYKDLLKYVTRDLTNGEADKTNSMVWFFEKRSFAISGEYFKIVWREPDDFDLINTDMGNSNFLLLRIDIFPITGHENIPKTWQTLLGNEDPPPEMVNFFDFLRNTLVSSECKPSKNNVIVNELDMRVPVFLWRKGVVKI